MTRADEDRDVSRPRVVVLMATYNGLPWLDEQIDSVIDQEGVEVCLRVSDDGSTDGTLEHLHERASVDPRIEVLPRREGPAGVTANFLHLFTTWEPTSEVYVAFSDQDDVWHPDKLRRQVNLLGRHHADVVSSDVVSFDDHGHRRLVVKSQPQVRWDYIFEAAGPGSTYVFTPGMHRELAELLCEVDTRRVGVHDWFLYALTRGVGGTWHIDNVPTVDYRQHKDNVQGENFGPAAMRVRLRQLRSGFYREQFVLTAEAVLQVGRKRRDAATLSELEGLLRCLRCRQLKFRWGITRLWRQIRRNKLEGFELALACLFGIW